MTEIPIVRCNDPADVPRFLAHVLATIALGRPFAWWTEEADGTLHLGFTIRSERGAFRITDPNLRSAGVFADFASAMRAGARLAQRARLPEAVS